MSLPITLHYLTFLPLLLVILNHKVNLHDNPVSNPVLSLQVWLACCRCDDMGAKTPLLHFPFYLCTAKYPNYLLF